MSQHPDSESAADTKPNDSLASSLLPTRDSYVKLAMRNMVRKSGTSLRHFALTTAGLLATLVGLAYIFH